MPHVIDTPAGLRGADKLARIPVKVDSARASPPKPPWLRARDPGTAVVSALHHRMRVPQEWAQN